MPEELPATDRAGSSQCRASSERPQVKQSAKRMALCGLPLERKEVSQRRTKQGESPFADDHNG
jgi:hypothetical protein